MEELTCLDCEHVFPLLSSEEKDPECPRCGGKRLERNPWLLGTSCKVSQEDYAKVPLTL